MFQIVLKRLREEAGYSQASFAKDFGSKQSTVAKWETGESLPDIDNCIALAQLYKVSLDDLVMYAKNPTSSNAPAGKHIFGVVKVDDKGRIVIPEKAREIFRIKFGDKLLMMGDEANGIAIVKLNSFLAATAEIMNIIRETDPDESDEG